MPANNPAALMVAVKVAGVVPDVGFTASQAAPVAVLALAIKLKGWPAVFNTMACCSTVLPEFGKVTARLPGLAVNPGTAAMVRVTGITTGLFTADEVRVMLPA